MLSILNNYLFFLFLTTLAVSNNLILFFISWIGMNVTLYGILLKSYNTYNKEITVKYFVSGSIITIFILFAILLYFMDYFTFNIDSASYLFLNNDNLSFTLESVNISKLQKIYYSVLISAFLFKLGSFPFHFYIADMYMSIKYMHTMLLYTIVLKIVMFFTLIKYLSCFWYLNTTISDLLICSGFGSIFVSSFTIIRQFKIMNFWAYSYINTIGYTILALSSGITAEFGELTFYSAKIYFLIYLIVWYGIMDLMSSFNLVRPSTILGSIKSSIYYINDFIFFSEISYKKNLNKNFSIYNKFLYYFNNYDYKFVKYSIIIFLLSLLGLPPTIGFFSKALVYFELVSNQNTAFILFLILLLTPVVSFGYIKLIIYTIFNKASFNILGITKIKIIPKKKYGIKGTF